MIEIIQILKLPAAVILIVLIFRKPIGELINNITDLTLTKDGLTPRLRRPQKILNKQAPDKPLNFDEINKKYFSEERMGKIVFNYSNNNGVYTIGENEFRFDTQWSKASKEYIHFYNDQPSIKSVRLAKDKVNLEKIDPNKYDSSSRARTAGVNQIAIFENVYGKFLTAKILALKDDSRGDPVDEIIFEYKILN